MKNNGHLIRPIYTRMRSLIRKIRFVDDLLMRFVRRIRRKNFEQFLRLGYLWPEDRKTIASDYLYSIQQTHRGPSQVVNMEHAVRYLAENSFTGSVVETGVFTGGASAYLLRSIMRNFPEAHNSINYWGFDSFEGMPTPTTHDGDHASRWIYGDRAHSIELNNNATLVGHDTNFADFEICKKYLLGTDYPPENIHLVKGWFQDTIVKHKNDIGKIALLRLDGDFYESTKVVMEKLYENVITGGVVIIDDYGAFDGCKLAVDEYLAAQNAPLPIIWYADKSICYFVKN